MNLQTIAARRLFRFGVGTAFTISAALAGPLLAHAAVPALTSISPSKGGVGTFVTLYGNNLQGVTNVVIYGTGGIFETSLQPPAFTIAPGGASIVVQFPDPSTFLSSFGPGTYQIKAQTPDGFSATSEPFTVTPAVPVISTTTPAQGVASDNVTILGSNFTAGGDPTVTLYTSSGALAGIIPASKMNYVSQQTLVFNPNAANVPFAPGIYQIAVSTPNGTSSMASYLLISTPSLTGITPASAVPGTTVTLQGVNLQGMTQVQFYNSNAQQVTSLPVASVSPNGTSITFIVPSGFLSGVGPGLYTLRVQNTAGTSNGESLTIAVPLGAVAAPYFGSIQLSPTVVTLGQPAVITWDAENATACTASGAWSGSESVTGSSTVVPTSTGVNAYALTCTGAGGSVSYSVLLTVNSANATSSSSTSPAVPIAPSPLQNQILQLAAMIAKLLQTALAQGILNQSQVNAVLTGLIR